MTIDLLLNNNNMKKSLVFKNLIAILLVGSTVFFASCIKNRNNGAPDFTQLQPVIQIINDKAGNAANSGLDGFSAAALLLDNSTASDSAAFRLNYAATGTAPADITVTLAYDAAALIAYNAANPNPVNPYTKFPDSIYTFTQTTVVVKAGTSYSDLVKLYVKPNKIDITKNYMLPISITAAGGVKISGNYGTIYFHLIGNPLAGKYNLIGTRYNFVGTVAYAGPVGSAANIPAGVTGTTNLTALSPKSAAPVDGQTVTMSFSNLGFGSGFEYGYLVTGNATFSAITLGWNDAFITGDSNIDGFIVAGSYLPPSPTQKPAFRFITHYNNNPTPGAGNDRIIDESFTHQ